jgi:hypothetical protein
MTTQPRRTRLTPQLVIGIAVATVGVLFTLDNLGFLYAGDFLRFWPIVLVVIGAVQITDARTPARVISGLIWLFLGSVMLGERLDLFRWNVWDFWPVVLVAAGGYIVWQAFVRDSGKSREADSAGMVSGIAVLGGFQRKLGSDDFRGGELTAFMGGCHLDLRGAKMVGGEAVLTVFAMMGGIELKVPEDWRVVVDVVPFLGGIEDRSMPPQEESSPRLVVKGFVMMGGVEVRN